MDLVERVGTSRVLPDPKQRRALRRALGIGQREMATELGVSVQTISAWENGKAAPTGARRERYAALLARMKHEAGGG
ncbi:helix-turn-helix domain-containing protein [Actinomycetospora flava]|uniref:Helix-turn-helix transcriptional regulator n=1 Tax=Actinomycetospora flava TaxID=3129232 RepID=A0ABU8MF69_9PSEU